MNRKELVDTVKGSLQKKHGKYYAVIRIDGKQKWINLHIPTTRGNRRKAEQAFKKVVADYTDTGIVSSNLLFLEYLDIWLSQIKQLVKPSSYESYEKIGATMAMVRLMKAVEGDTDAKAGADTINVGDKVRIVNGAEPDDVYGIYGRWIKKYAPEYALYYAYGADLPTEKFDYYFVLKKAEHDIGKHMLCLISLSPDPISEYRPCYLIAEENLRKVAQ